VNSPRRDFCFACGVLRGAGLVTAYRSRGWAVVASARGIKPASDPGVLTVSGDICEPATADRIIGGAVERFGRVDTLINNAGVFIRKPFTDYTARDYAAIIGVNLTAFFLLTQRAVAEMLKGGGGHIVNITATLAEYANSSAPSALAALTKGGLASVTKSLAVEYAARGIRVNAVSPSVVQTWQPTPGDTRGARRATLAARAGGPGQRHRQRRPLPRVIAVHHRRDPAHRRRPERRPLTRATQRVGGRCRGGE